MQFLFPTFLLALATLAIPIIIHLFYFRRFKKVYFTHVRLLKEVKEETSNRQKLRNLLVLLMRCLALAAMVLAFAQPYLPSHRSVRRGEKAVSIFVDNSFSMNALSKDAALLDIAKLRAREIVSAFTPDDRFQILTNDFEGRDQRLISQEDALTRIEEITVSPATKDLSKVLIRQQQCLATGKSEHRVAFLVSDFQKNICDLDAFQDSTLAVNLVPLRAVQEKNVSIDSAWFDSPVQILNQPARLMVKISNRSDGDAEEIRLSLHHDGQTRPVGSFNLPARQSKIDTVSFNILHPGWHEARVSLTDYPVQFDDDYYISFPVAERINILTINGLSPNRFIRHAFAAAKYFQMDDADVRNLDYSKFANYQLILLNEVGVISSGLANELSHFAKNGGNVMVFPGLGADVGSYNGLLQVFGGSPLGGYEKVSRQATQLNTDEFVFRDVYLNKNAPLRLPTSQGNYKIAAGRGENIISYRDGTAMLVKYAVGDGALYFSAIGLSESESDLVRNPEVFVPMLFKMAISGARNAQIAHIIGRDEVLEATHRIAASGETIYKLIKKSEKSDPGNKTDEVEFIPEQRIIGNKVLLTPGKSMQTAGWYHLHLKSDTTLAVFAFNYDRKESELSYLSNEALRQNAPGFMQIIPSHAAANLTLVVGEQTQGIVLWRWCIVFALLFLALEVLFLRLWK